MAESDAKLALPIITRSPQSANRIHGEKVSFSITVKGMSALGLHWMKDGEAITGANDHTYSIASVTSEHLGSYKCVVSSIVGSVESKTVKLAGINHSFLLVLILPS